MPNNNISARGIQIGAKTQIHGQLITLHNFNTMKISLSKPQKLKQQVTGVLLFF